jgi:hypothetical protein
LYLHFAAACCATHHAPSWDETFLADYDHRIIVRKIGQDVKTREFDSAFGPIPRMKNDSYGQKNTSRYSGGVKERRKMIETS